MKTIAKTFSLRIRKMVVADATYNVCSSILSHYNDINQNIYKLQQNKERKVSTVN